MRDDSGRFARLLSLVVLSGAAALAVEVVISRILARTIGSTTWSVAFTLSGVLGGMGLGAWLGERWLERSKLPGSGGPFSRPLAAYASCEIAALALGIVFATSADALGALLRIPGGEALVLTAVVILAAPWGASFPCIVRGLGGPEATSARLPTVYGLNAVGGAIGALGAGLLAIPALGEWGTLIAAAALQLVVCGGALALDRSAACGAGGGVLAPTEARDRRTGSLAAFIFASGFLVLYWEALWTRLLTLTVGSTVHAFSIISASVVLGIGLGSLAWRGKWFALHGGWALPLASAALAGALFFVVPHLPDAYLAAVRFGGASPLISGSLGAGLIVFVPNFLLGSLFPWGTSKAVARSGRLYALNALGCIAGAFAGGPLGAQHLGLELAFAAGGLGLVLLSGIGIFAAGLRFRAVVMPWSALVLAGAALLALTGSRAGLSWDWRRIVSGVYQWSRADLENLSLRESLDSREVLHVTQGVEAIVSAEIERDSNTIHIRANGKVEGGMPLDPALPSLADLPTQILLGELPRALLQGSVQPRVLQIGLGSGTTLGALWSDGNGIRADSIDLIEIERGFVDALMAVKRLPGAREVVPYSLLEEGDGSRPRLHVGDARRIISLELRRARWDAIVSQPSEPWIPGSAPLFTVEFFDLASRRLSDGGVFFQWLQLYKLEWDTFRMAVRTFRRAFPVVFVLRPPATGEVILLGSARTIDLDRLLGASAGPKLALARIEAPVDRLAIFLLGPNGVDDLVGLDPSLPVNTDSRSELEYLAARGLHTSPELARETLRRLQEAGGRDPISRYLAPAQRRDRRFLRLLAARNARLGDFEEALAILLGDESEEASAIRLQIEAEKGR